MECLPIGLHDFILSRGAIVPSVTFLASDCANKMDLSTAATFATSCNVYIFPAAAAHKILISLAEFISLVLRKILEMSANKNKIKSNLNSKDSAKDTAASSSGSKRKDRQEDGEEKNDDHAEHLRRKHKFIRSTIRTDYQPDICKDYKNTGFCGFGDSCKFLHDRSDYKHGWQIDQEWEKGQYREEDDEKYLIERSDEEDYDDADKCAICKEPYKEPVIMKCKHIFCSDCADKECTGKCFTCEKPTSGIFKNASKLVNKPK